MGFCKSPVTSYQSVHRIPGCGDCGIRIERRRLVPRSFLLPLVEIPDGLGGLSSSAVELSPAFSRGALVTNDR